MHYVDLGESFPTHIFLQILASIQPRTSPLKFARSSHFELCERLQPAFRGAHLDRHLEDVEVLAGAAPDHRAEDAELGRVLRVRRAPPVEHSGAANFTGLILGCIEAKFSNIYF